MVTVARAVSDAVADERRFAQVVLDLVVRFVGDGATLWLPSPDDSLVRAGADHVDEAARPAPQDSDICVATDGDTLIGAALASGAPVVLRASQRAPESAPDDAAEDSVLPASVEPELVPWYALRGVADLAAVPLRGETRATGVLVATRDAGRPGFTADDVTFLQALADVAAATLATAYLVNGSAAAVEEMRRQADLVDQVSDVIMAWDVEHQVVTWNAAAERVYLYSAAEALGCDAQTLLATRFIAIDGEELNRDQVLAALVETGGWSGELRQRRADGAEIEVLSSVTGLFDWYGQLTGAVAVNRDVTDQRHKEQLAMRDVLTGLPNRRFLTDHLRHALARCAVGGGPLAVLFLDLDGFKQVNDTLGHEAGDEVLRVMAQRLGHALRRHDVVTRLGGDEFVAVTEEVGGRENAEDVARRLLESAGQPMMIADREIVVLPSIGVTVIGPERAAALRVDELVREADQAMYEAKRGRAGFAFSPYALPAGLPSASQ
jgi:diguanylate cyclase (GGDEF)-like protein/PAS domain S-box-containing protein